MNDSKEIENPSTAATGDQIDTLIDGNDSDSSDKSERDLDFIENQPPPPIT